VQAGFTFMGVDESEVIEVGNTILKVLHTPGHTPEHISLVVTDRSRGEDPWFVLTGHTLMVGDVGRTELASSAEEGAGKLYHSLFYKLLLLSDHLEILPGAFSGSVCGRSLSGKPSSTIGFEKKYNKALQMNEESEFITYMLKDIPERPPLFNEIRLYNMGLTDQLPV
jgi:hydroxyacylglutathione hydrolase